VICTTKVICILKTITVEQVSWESCAENIRPIRQAVFIDEQQVPVELEWDGLDEHCIHLLAYNNDQPVGTARMTAAGKIGRMAVLKSWRRYGAGSALLERMVSIARGDGLTEVVLDAQVYATPFYANFEFRAFGEEFMDAGIAHRKMRLQL